MFPTGTLGTAASQPESLLGSVKKIDILGPARNTDHTKTQTPFAILLCSVERQVRHELGVASVSLYSFSWFFVVCCPAYRCEMTGKVVLLAVSLLLCCWPCSVCAQEG